MSTRLPHASARPPSPCTLPTRLSGAWQKVTTSSSPMRPEACPCASPYRKPCRVGWRSSHKGRWPKREAARANVNVLNPGHKTDMGESTCVHGVEIVVTPLTQP